MSGWEHLSVVVKIDVEGFELVVLRALEKTRVIGQAAKIIIEVSHDNLGPGGVVSLYARMAELGYTEISRAGPRHHYDACFQRLSDLAWLRRSNETNEGAGFKAEPSAAL